MGIADRDYTRSTPPLGARVASRRSRNPFVNRWRVTTWLIVINIAVFILSNLVFTTPVFTSFGREVFVGATNADIAASFAFPTPPTQLPDRPGVFARPFFVAERDAAGTPLIDPRTGNPALRIVGRELFIRQPVLHSWGHFSTAEGFFGLQVWRFVTFQFLHAGLMHLGFNILGLYFVGYLVEDYLRSRRFLAFYLTCGIFGALLYLLLNLTGNLMVHQFGMPWATKIPFLLFDSIHTPLVGASAGIFGVLLAAAFIAPDERVDVMYFIPMKMRTAVYGFTLLAFGNLLFNSDNAGGEAAHIGGAIAGYFFIRRMHLLRDFFDLFGDSRPPEHIANERVRRSFFARLLGTSPLERQEAEVDRILKKIMASGLDSLTDREKATLKDHSESKRRTP